jgi:ABC-2 type transport system ATP-binding protein
MIRVENLRKEYGDVVALDKVSFEVPAGQVLGFLGPNGAGKSTTIKILTTYVHATSGSASVAGHDVARDAFEVRRALGYLPEHAPLYLDMTVLDYLSYAARVRSLGARPARRRAIARVMSICSLFDVAGRRIGQLSKGFRQRVGLAQAMIHDPQVLILDEPTSGLDPIQIQEIRQVIRRLGERRTVIFSTHIIPEVEVTCDRVLIIDRGRLVADGSPESLRNGASKARYVIRWRGELEQFEQRLAAAGLENKIRVVDSGQSGPVLELSAELGDEVTVGGLSEALARDGALVGLEPDRASLEEAFFAAVGRRAEARAVAVKGDPVT